MKTFHLFAVLLSLPLLLGGCGEKEVNFEELEEREGIYYVSGSDTPHTGKSFTLNENGKKASERNFKDGKMNGLWMAWYDNGQKQSVINFKAGKFDGPSVKWHKNGQKFLIGNFKDGKPDGPVVKWYANEQMMEEGNFKDGKPDGLQLA